MLVKGNKLCRISLLLILASLFSILSRARLNINRSTSKCCILVMKRHYNLVYNMIQIWKIDTRIKTYVFGCDQGIKASASIRREQL